MKDILINLLQNEMIVGIIVALALAALRKRGMMNAANFVSEMAPVVVSALNQENKAKGLTKEYLKAEAVHRLTKMLPEGDRLAAMGKVKALAETSVESAVAVAKERKEALGKLEASE